MAVGVDLVVGHLLGLVRDGAVGFAGSGQRFHDTDAKSVVRLAGTGCGNRGHGEQCGLKGKESDTAEFGWPKSHISLRARRGRGEPVADLRPDLVVAVVYVSIIVGRRTGNNNRLWCGTGKAVAQVGAYNRVRTRATTRELA